MGKTKHPAKLQSSFPPRLSQTEGILVPSTEWGPWAPLCCVEGTQDALSGEGKGGAEPGTVLGEGSGHSRPHSLNFHSCRHMGQCCCTCCAFSHLRMQCIWKQCEHCPHTRGQSSPGTLQSGQQPLNAILQMPQFSSLATQSQVATPFQHLIFTFMTTESVT